MTNQTEKLLAAASSATAAATDMIEVARDGRITAHDNVGAGDTLAQLADSLRLLIDAMETESEHVTQLHGTLVRFLED